MFVLLVDLFLCMCRQRISKIRQTLRQSAGNFYINCQSTGSVVGQQPFGGSRASGEQIFGL